MTLGIGIIGCGYISAKHVETLSQFTSLELRAVSDPYTDRMNATSEKYRKHNGNVSSIQKYKDATSLINDPDIDIVVIATQSDTHAALAKATIQANKHVVIEKPVALSMNDARELVQLSNLSQKQVLVCHQLRYRPVLAFLKQLIDTNVLGQLYLGEVTLSLNRPESYYTVAPWRGQWDKDGGMLINQAIHLIDLLVWYFGEINHVFGDIVTVNDFKETEDIANALLTFKSGAKGIIHANTITKPKNKGYSINIFAQHASICLSGHNLDRIDHLFIENGKVFEDRLYQIVHQHDEHERMYKDLLQSISDPTHNLQVSLESTLFSLESIFAIYQSHLCQSVISLPICSFDTKMMK